MKTPVWILDEAQIKAPLAQAGLAVERAEQVHVEDAFLAQYKLDHDKATYARNVANWVRAPSEPFLALHIAPERRPQAVEALYEEIERIVADALEENAFFDFSFGTHILALRKVETPSARP